MSKIINLINSLFLKYSSNLFCILLLAIPLKLSISYIFFFPLMILGLTYLVSNKEISSFFSQNQRIISIWLLFLLIALISGAFGVSSFNSIFATAELAFYSCSIPVFYHLICKQKNLNFLLFLVLGQAIASLYSVFEFYDPETFKRIFIGAVTESGQITLTFFITLGLLCLYLSKSDKKLVATSALMLILIFAALLLNMKRGPWGGVLLGGVFFFLMYRPKLLLIFIPLIILPIAFWAPLQERLLSSLDHLFLLGGRADIWELGLELAGRYPIGIGFDNCGIMNDFSNIIPKDLTHFHSNILNILVEVGLFGLMVFLWFWFELIRTAYQDKKSHVILYASVSAIIAWFTAGIVEYNFGDSEVMLIVYLVVAIILSKCQPKLS